MLGLPSDAGIDELLLLIGLGDTSKKEARNFSLGMRQRLDIAVALAGSADFLVLDEPTNGLDPQGIIEMHELILKLNREQGITVLISSHILDELSRLTTHYGFIDGGRMVREMSAEELEAHCRKCVRIEVSDTKALARVLDGMSIDYRITDDTHADIYAEIPVTELVSALTKKLHRKKSDAAGREPGELLIVTIVVLAVAVAVLLIYLLSLCFSLKEIAGELDDKLKTETNTLISISSGDRAVRVLAARINEQLRALRGERLRLQHGDVELKNAVTNISHDLRTPLTAICGSPDLFAQQP